MTITMSNVVLIDPKGEYHLFDELAVAARKIRQIQLPNLVSHSLSFLIHPRPGEPARIPQRSSFNLRPS